MIIPWVDNVLLIGSAEEVKWMQAKLEERFTIEDLGPVTFFLSMFIERIEKSALFLSVKEHTWIECWNGLTWPNAGDALPH
jgi:hypothetical protein